MKYTHSQGLQATILRILINDTQVGCNLQLQNKDVLYAYCSILPEQSIITAIQSLCKNTNYYSNGIISILQSLQHQHPSFNSIQSLDFANQFLNDQDLYTFLLPLKLPFTQLTTINLEKNFFTDIAAELISIWILHSNCPQLEELSIGYNVWHGKGLEKLLFALQNCQLRSLVRKPPINHL